MSKQSISAYEAMASGTPSLLARIYYKLKPLIPLHVRLALRRGRARRIKKRFNDTWPIDESAAAAPQGWSGWPDERDFAIVFTHDVESIRGVKKVKDLANIEITRGIRSSYNFIPEGPYVDPCKLRRWLTDNGFEVGVHDLNHDGHLYDSKQGFKEKAEKINHYLKEWGSVGFRSAFMLRQLDWMHDLNVLYDASTFDTDPFEPQPQGSQTIFPFEVRSNVGGKERSYVELPYTLAQDSTVFLLLGEETADVWKTKLDWIAEKGGLALVNIHPDYIDFTGKRSLLCYPASLIRDFLDHLNASYRGRFWNPLPRELADWYRTQGSQKEEIADHA